MKLALVFPGQGSQAIGMAKDFFENFKEAKMVFEECSDAIHVNLKKLCFDGPMDELTLTENLQPALFTTEVAMFSAIKSATELDIKVTAGHSLGEYSALCAAGVLSLSDGVRLTRARGRAMQEAVPVGTGTMAAILGLSSDLVENLCKAAAARKTKEVVEPANFNAPGQVVIAGSVAGVAEAMAILKEDPTFKGGKAIPLQVSAPFHCSLMKPAQKEMAPLIAKTEFLKPMFPLIPNVTARICENENEFAGTLTDQITAPVRWEMSMKSLRNMESSQRPEIVIEIGPGKVLSSLQKRIDSEMPAKSVSTVDQMKEVFKT